MLAVRPPHHTAPCWGAPEGRHILRLILAGCGHGQEMWTCDILWHLVTYLLWKPSPVFSQAGYPQYRCEVYVSSWPCNSSQLMDFKPRGAVPCSHWSDRCLGNSHGLQRAQALRRSPDGHASQNLLRLFGNFGQVVETNLTQRKQIHLLSIYYP